MATISQIFAPLNPKSSEAKGRYAHLDALRAVAILIVVVSHSSFGEIIQGGLGVTIFFVISGFIITHLMLKEFAATGSFQIKRFFERRFFKIGPPLIITILLPGLLFALFSKGSLFDWFSQLGFFFNWVFLDDHANIIRGSSVVWSLSIEEQFYITFALLWLWFTKGKNPVKRMIATAAIVAIGSAGDRILLYFTGASGTRIYYGTDTRIEAIAIGVLLAALMHEAGSSASLVKRAKPTNKHLLDVGLAAAIIVLSITATARDDFFVETWRYSVQALAAAYLIAYGFQKSDTLTRKLFDRIIANPLIQLIGLASYSIYLTHLMLIYSLAPRLHTVPVFYKAAIFVGVAIFAGTTIYFTIERPIAILKSQHR